MNGFLASVEPFLQTAVQMGTPILLATLGGILSEKVGNMNLGIEGMMLMGAAVGFISGAYTGSPLLSLLAAGLAGWFGALIYGVIAITLKGNQVVTGLVLTIFGGGVSAFLGKGLTGISMPESIVSFFAAYRIPLLAEIPLIGEMLFEQGIYVHLGILIAVAMYFLFKKTRIGLNIRAVGENPGAADASGVPVNLYKYVCVTLGGFLCGLGGAYLSLVFVPRWQENITAGIGWIAVALIIFSVWNPLRAIAGAYFFGALRGIGFKIQNLDLSLFGMKVTIAPQFLDMIPYVMTVVALVVIACRKRRENQPPAGLGNPYFREDR